MGCTYKQEGHVLPFTNVSTTTAIAVDTVILLPGRLGIALAAIPASGVGSLSLSGVHDLPALSTDAWKMGDPLFWDASVPNLTRVNATGANRFAGLAAADKAVTTGVRATVRLNDHGDLPEDLLNKAHIDTGINLTLVAATHSGAVIRATVASLTITLPIGVVGMDFGIVNDCADADAGAGLLTVDLNGNEIIAGGNATMAATKTFINALATSKRGDFIHLVCNVAATSWRCVTKRGVWAATA
jgi:predicted RecA/RadA family phage recombinase